MASNYFTETFGKDKKEDSKSKKKNAKKDFYKKLESAPSKVPAKPERVEKSAPAKITTFPYKTIASQFDTKSLPKDCVEVLQNFDQILQEVRPLNSKQILNLPDNIRELSHQLTDQRSTRRLGYMNENIQLSAYVRYFTWWNLVRMTRLFANLPKESFPAKDGICLDLGSGPLTIVTALWLARPELRKLKLTWYCLDVSQNALTLGEDIYMTIAARTMDADVEEHWKIIRVKDSFGSFIKQKADFITSGNMFNELDQTNDMPPEFKVKKYYEQLKAYAASDAKFLLIEPGVPKSARTLSLFRERFIHEGKEVLAPCPHSVECPMNGFKSYTGSKNKWCNFAFNTEDAPARLQKLSEQAKLPKERAVLSFISAISADNNTKKQNAAFGDGLKIRIASDPFKLPNFRTGFYACSELGLTLVTVNSKEADKLHSGDLISVKTKTPDLGSTLKRDQKSGAVIIDL